VQLAVKFDLVAGKVPNYVIVAEPLSPKNDFVYVWTNDEDRFSSLLVDSDV